MATLEMTLGSFHFVRCQMRNFESSENVANANFPQHHPNEQGEEDAARLISLTEQKDKGDEKVEILHWKKIYSSSK